MNIVNSLSLSLLAGRNFFQKAFLVLCAVLVLTSGFFIASALVLGGFFIFPSSVFADSLVITSAAPLSFTPAIGSTLSLGTDAYIGRNTNYTGSALGTPGDTIQWRVTVHGPAALTADMVHLDEVGWTDTHTSSAAVSHYPLAVNGDNDLVTTGSCDTPDLHDNSCAHVVGFSLDTNDNFTNADKIRFNANAPTGAYTITYKLVNTADDSVVGTYTASVTVLGTSVITSAAPLSFTPAIGSTLSLGTDAYIGRNTNYTGSALGTPGDTIQWRVTVHGPSALTADMVNLKEVGWTDTHTSSNAVSIYPLAAVSGDLVTTGSCDAGASASCVPGAGFSLDTNDNFTNADKIKFNANAPTGAYTIKYELVNTADGAVVGTMPTVSVTVLSDVSVLTAKKGIADGLIVANASESTTPGQHVVGSLATLSAANTAANATSADAQSVVDGQVTTLNAAINAYNAAVITLSFSAVTNLDGSLSASVTNTTEASTTSNGIQVTMTIPAGTTINGPSSWDGSIVPPTATTSFTLTADSGNTASAQLAIEMGFGNTVLTFDKAVRILMAGQAGKFVGYSRGGVFTAITTVCTDDTQATNDLLSAGGNCKIDVGSDLVVWTKHFTTFISYTQTAIPAPASAPAPSVGGGGPISSGGGGFAAPFVPSQTGIVAIAPAGQPAGTVLGAATFRFTQMLQIGSKGDDVTQLQKHLTQEGVYSGPITGYFGQLTLAAVKSYQGKKGIEAIGIVGPKTRNFLNNAPIQASTPAAGAVLGAVAYTPLAESQIQSVLNLLKAFDVDQATINNVNAALRGQPTR